jgi:type I restriction enzyme S subunit
MEVVEKGYKITEVGKIPSDWEVVSIEQLTNNGALIRGPFGGALKKEFFVRAGYKVYEQKNAIYESVELGNYYIDEKKFKELKRFEIFEGDFILSCSGTIGRLYQIPSIFQKGIINQALLIIRINGNEFDTDYFKHQFTSDTIQKKVIDDTQGGAMKNLVGMSEFKKVSIPFPSNLTEQKRIATALSDVNSLISSLDKLIQKKKAIKQGAMQELLTGKTRLAGFGNDAGFKMTEMGRIPRDWNLLNLGRTSILKARIGWQGLTTAEYQETGQYILITGTDFEGGFINWESCVYVSKNRFDQDKNIQVETGDVLVTKDGTIGKVAYIDSVPLPTTLNSGVFVIRPKNHDYDSKFFYHILMSMYFREFLSKLSAGSTINHLYQKDFVHFNFPLPPTLNEQKAIAATLSDMDSEIQNLETKRDKYKQIKQGMMQELLTGKTRLV